MAKDSCLSGGNIVRRNESLSRQATIIADDDAGQRRQLVLRAILLNWSKKITNGGPNNAGEFGNNIVGQYLTMRGCQSQQTPELL
jgi:hypothetical protein